MFVVFCVLSLMLFLVAFVLLRRLSKDILLSADNIVILSVAFFYGIIFPIVYFYSLKNPNSEYLIIISNYDALDLIIYYICIAAFLVLFVNVFRLSVDKSHSNMLVIEDNNVECVADKSSQLYIATILLLVVGVLSDFLYCRAYGGYLGYLEYSGFIRSGITNLISNRWSFLIVFRDCVIIASYLLFSQIKKNDRIQFGRLSLFVVSFVYSLLILYANKGRISFLIYIAVFLITYVCNKRKIKFFNIKAVFYMVVAFFVFIAGTGWVSGVVSRTSEFSGFNMICNEVAFVFSNFKLLLSKVDIENFRCFIDIVFYPLFLLPSSLWRRIMPDTASDIMTILTFGNKKGQGGILGETPVDAISIGYLQSGIIGVCVFAVFWGFMSAKLYKKISSLPNYESRNIMTVNIVLDVLLRSLIYADSYNIVQRCFSLIVFALIYWGVGFFRTKKHSRII